MLFVQFEVMYPCTFIKKPLHILVVEDNKINSELMEYHLGEVAKVDIALSGEIAISKAHLNLYDMILLDIHLGTGINGFAVQKTIRAIENYRNVPIIAVTGWASEADEKEILSRGFNGFLAKPFTKQQLMDEIAKTMDWSSLSRFVK